jgi:metal-dependent amidase/aminoacylase/carboxypeptidase family protein
MNPDKGVNALNAVIHLFTGIDALRQHVRSDVRMHGVITDGGTAPNVVPDFAAANFMLRSSDRHYLSEVVEKVQRVAEGAALLTGAELAIKPFFPNYENIRPNAVLASRARANAELVGLPLDEASGPGMSASTDFGNVSQRIPSFALSFAVSPTPVAGHSLAMTETARSELAHERALQAAKILALTALDVLEDDDLLRATRADFELRSS